MEPPSLPSLHHYSGTELTSDMKMYKSQLQKQMLFISFVNFEMSKLLSNSKLEKLNLRSRIVGLHEAGKTFEEIAAATGKLTYYIIIYVIDLHLNVIFQMIHAMLHIENIFWCWKLK
jgi:hypothetical protein